MQSGVHGRPGSELLRRKALEDLVQRERIVSKRIGVRLEVRERRLRRLLVALDRSRLAVPHQAVVIDLDLYDLDLGLGPARDRERLLELERGDRGSQLHGRRLGTPDRLKMRPAGIEPATSRSGGARSIP